MTVVHAGTVADGEREEALRRYDVENLQPQDQLQALVELAGMVCEAPMAAINLIGARDQHRVATVGIGREVCNREGTLCSTSILEAEPVLVADARLDSRFADNAFVTGERGAIRFYASQQLRTPEGVVIGTLCVFDGQPRELSPGQAEALATLAARVVDVLELELSARRMAAVSERLASSDDRLAAVVGQVGHDLNNPLHAIAMSLQLASHHAIALPPESQDPLVSLLRRASRGAERMHAMVVGLLEFAQSDRVPRRESVEAAQLVEEAREDLGDLTTGAELRIGALPTLWADPAQLRLLLQNLIGNALKFSRHEPAPLVVVRAVRRGDAWRFEVADNGPGIALEERDRVFEVFARPAGDEPGTGVGLATCQRIVTGHGGSIGVATAPEGGALVWFELPDQPGDELGDPAQG